MTSALGALIAQNHSHPGNAGFVAEVRDGAFLLRTVEGDIWLTAQATYDLRGGKVRLECDLASSAVQTDASPA
jgi:hypothetical protein